MNWYYTPHYLAKSAHRHGEGWHGVCIGTTSKSTERVVVVTHVNLLVCLLAVSPTTPPVTRVTPVITSHTTGPVVVVTHKGE